MTEWGLLVPQVMMIWQWGVKGTQVCWSWSGWLGYLCAMINIVMYLVVVVKVMQVMENDTKHDVCPVTLV